MNIAVITPTKGDRPEFLNELRKMIQAQTIQPDIHIVVDDVHECTYADVTWRYKLGFERALESGADVFVVMEDDDWYAPTYIQEILMAWKRAGKPHLFGVGNTLYYHIGMRKYTLFTHPERASMMATVIRADTPLVFCKDENPFLDLHMWMKLEHISKDTIMFPKHLTIGIKHGIGLVAGGGHTKENIYARGSDDLDMTFLRGYVGDELVNFYKTITNG